MVADSIFCEKREYINDKNTYRLLNSKEITISKLLELNPAAKAASAAKAKYLKYKAKYLQLKNRL